MFCPKCGSQVNDGDLFCRKCGFKLIYPEGENVYTNSTPFMNTDEMQVQQNQLKYLLHVVLLCLKNYCSGKEIVC